MKHVTVIVLLLIFLPTLLFADRPVRDCGWEVLTVAETDSSDSALVYFPTPWARGNQPELDGNLCIKIQPVDVDGSQEDSLSVWIRTIHLDMDNTYTVNEADSIIVVEYLDWADGLLYTYPVTDAFGPCIGVCIYMVYNGAAGADSVEVSATAVVQ